MVAAIASTVVYVIGTVLYGALAGLVLRRRSRTWGETILLLLGLSAAVWYLGNALDRFAYLLFTERIGYVVTATDVICCLGIALVPSLLMIMALLYLHEHGRPLPRWVLAALVGGICMLALPFSLVLVNVISGQARLASISQRPEGQVFLGWLAFSLVSSAWVCFRQRRQATEPQEERFFRMLFWGTVAVAVAIAACPLLMAARPTPGPPSGEVDLIISLGGLFPGMVFAYYVYRYNYLEFILRRTLLHGSLTLLVIGIYYFLILELARWLGLKLPTLNVALVEALLVIGLVYLFPQIGRTVRDVLRFIAFSRTADAEYRLATLNREISSDPMLEPERLLEGVCREIAGACAARRVSLVLRREAGLSCHGSRPQGAFGNEEFEAVVGACAEAGSAWIERREVRNVPCLAAMRMLGAQTVHPVVSEGAYRGFIAVGRTPRMMPLTEEASRQLVVTAHRVSAAMGRARQIRETLQLQRRLYAKERLTSLGHLAAGVAHEVRNPLGSIKTLVQVLAEELAQKGIQAEETELIVDEINRLNRAVNGLLRYARPGDAARREVDFAEALATILQLIHHETERRGCRLRVDVPEHLPPVRAGEDEIKEVLLNLILNALEAMPSGGDLAVKARLDGDRLLVDVADTGRGIPEADLDKVFEPSFTTKEGGTGLGLSIVRDRLQEIGGAIHCDSSPGGTTMALELPLAERAAEG